MTAEKGTSGSEVSGLNLIGVEKSYLISGGKFLSNSGKVINILTGEVEFTYTGSEGEVYGTNVTKVSTSDDGKYLIIRHGTSSEIIIVDSENLCKY